MSGLISSAVQIREQEDPAVTIRLCVKDLIDDIRIGGQDVLVGVYVPAKDARSSGGIILPDGSREEYRWQGVTGLILKLGPFAYKTEKTTDWFCDEDGNSAPPKIGDWVMFDVKDTHAFLLSKQPCRFVPCQYVRGIVSRPDLVA